MQVFLPQFPIEEGQQTLQNWLETISPLREYLTGSIMVGHSLGVPFILNILNYWDVKIKAAFLVGGFGEQHSAQGEPNMDEFAAKDFDWNKIKGNCESFYIIHSDNDPYVPLDNQDDFRDKLDSKIIIEHNKGHFNSKAGVTELPVVFEELLKMAEVNK